ncbi:MAG TPA: hypothetical protein VGO80_04285 [Solirubrobacteraceae bacterium]|jgi:uncharacterized membrane protein YkoI|nr:hypothetical protein [Solirubrobacteraceae bacterium]
MPKQARKTLLMLGAFCALAVGGSALAGAATKTKTSSAAKSASSTRPERPAQETLTGDTADKVKAAALAKVPGGTVLRAESGGHGGAAYHAHVRKSDGSEVVVLVDKDFNATSVETRPAGGRGGHGGGGRHGGPDRRPDEKPLTGDTAAKVTAAAKAKVSGGTVLRVETDGDHGSPYEAHVRKSDGSEVEVLVNKDFEVTAVNEMGRRP